MLDRFHFERKIYKFLKRFFSRSKFIPFSIFILTYFVSVILSMREVVILSNETLDELIERMAQDCKKELKKQSDSDNYNNEIYLIEKYQRKYFYDKYNNDER